MKRNKGHPHFFQDKPPRQMKKMKGKGNTPTSQNGKSTLLVYKQCNQTVKKDNK